MPRERDREDLGVGPSAYEIEVQSTCRAEGREEVMADMLRALRVAGVVIHWTDGGGPGDGPACNHKGRCFTWDDGDLATCWKCQQIWGNQEVA
jgi:hypothetical protein